MGQVHVPRHLTSPQRHRRMLRSAVEDAEAGLKDAGICFVPCKSVPGKGSVILFVSSTFCVSLLYKAWICGLSLTAGVSPKWASFIFATAGATRLVVKGCCSLPVTQCSDPRHSSACCLCSQPRKVPVPGEEISWREITFNAVTMSSLQETSYPQFAVLQLRQASLLLSWENRTAIHVRYEK